MKRHCCDHIASIQVFAGKARSARSTLVRIRRMVVGQSSSVCRTQPAMHRFMRRSVAERGLRSAAFSGSTYTAKSAVGLTHASNKRMRKHSEMCLLTSRRRLQWNVAHAAEIQLFISASTLSSELRLRRLPRYRCDASGGRICKSIPQTCKDSSVQDPGEVRIFDLAE